jgi:DNA repair protein RecO (recombination protein O)
MAENALALVVRGTDWSETSRIVTLFTREFGKVRALAKGGRRLRSNFEQAFDLLTVCRIVFLRKAHGGLDLLTEAQVAERFPHLRTDLHALNVGYYVAELLSDGTQDYDPHPELFDAAVATLRGLASGGRQPAVSAVPAEQRADAHRSPDPVSAFELVWLKELGYSPRLDACAVCARGLPVPSPEPTRVAYSPEAGGAVCPNCSPAARDRRPLSDPARLALIALAGGTSGARGPLALSPQVRAEVRAVLGQTVSYVLGRRPRLLGYVDAPP